jgi:IS5 family transposase
LRCALLKQYRQLSYEELAFHLEDSASFRAFARLPLGWSPKKSVLHRTISAISAANWEAINRAVVMSARHEKLDDGAMLRIDSTVTEALMHAPTDSSLLFDEVELRKTDRPFELVAYLEPPRPRRSCFAKTRQLTVASRDLVGACHRTAR